MTKPKSISDEERRGLLGDLAKLSTDADDAVKQDPKWFLPLASHGRALRPETLVVRGGRGAGKSALFQFLAEVEKRPDLAAHVPGFRSGGTRWIEGYGRLSVHPPDQVLGRFVDASDEAQRRHFWFGLLCRCLAKAKAQSLPPGDFAQTCEQLEANWDIGAFASATGRDLGRLSAWLDALERSLPEDAVVTYDALDRIGASSSTRQRVTASLLAMWLSLADRYRRVRPKIFVREDLFQASLAAFPDASKLDARSASIEWRVEDIYRVLIKHMANTSDELKAWVEGSARGIRLVDSGALGWMPPNPLPETGKPSQKDFVDHLAGPQMGTGLKKGLTYRWIPNRLQDAHGRIVPRSILSLLGHTANYAIDHGPKAQSLRLVTPEELAAALEKTSKRRAQELAEEFPVVQRLEALRDKQVMLERRQAVALLATPRDGDEYGSDGERVLASLIELGAMSERSEGKIDVPDIYRYGFGIKRKGGVKRPR